MAQALPARLRMALLSVMVVAPTASTQAQATTLTTFTGLCPPLQPCRLAAESLKAAATAAVAVAAEPVTEPSMRTSAPAGISISHTGLRYSTPDPQGNRGPFPDHLDVSAGVPSTTTLNW